MKAIELEIQKTYEAEAAADRAIEGARAVISSAMADKERAQIRREAFEYAAQIYAAQISTESLSLYVRPGHATVSVPSAEDTTSGTSFAAPSIIADFSTRIANKGRQPGAISSSWRRILAEMSVLLPDGATEADIVEIGRTCGITNLVPKNARAQMVKYTDHSYVWNTPNGWVVTDFAVQKLKLKTLIGATSSDEDPGTNEAGPESVHSPDPVH